MIKIGDKVKWSDTDGGKCIGLFYITGYLDETVFLTPLDRSYDFEANKSEITLVK